NTDNYRKADGTGWIPVNFTSLTTTPNPLTLLPVDPTNSTSTGLYYTYVNGSWELTALFETTNYQTKYGSTDNGASPSLFELGNHLKITPNAMSQRPYMSVYPPEQSDIYVKATSKFNTTYWPYFVTDPTKNLISTPVNNQWYSANAYTNQRFHIDLGSAKIIKRIYYENAHNSGASGMVYGVKNFTFWGSNNPAAFADLVYGNDAEWTQIPTAVTLFDIHVSANTPDPKYILVTNTTAYRYYAFKFANTYYNGDLMGIRRIELQTND
ncbi:MAG: hypothetical protein WC297_02740, partial [Candidatus Paceibacterota bacterium]